MIRTLFRRLSLCAGITLAAVIVAACGGPGSGTVVTVPNASPEAQQGAQLVASQGCVGCHSTDGAKASGPTFQHLAGKTVELKNGQSITANDEYIRRSITNADAEIVDGYNSGVMSAYMDNQHLTDAEIDAMVAYIDSLK